MRLAYIPSFGIIIFRITSVLALMDVIYMGGEQQGR
uniref:Uncharacterized protein n=1 Tax=Arundo donax TaxID=35708 RepID=A0A0A8XZW9_ARUDO